MKRYLSLLPAVLLLLTACDPKPDRAAPLPKMVKVAEVVKAGNAQQRVFPARIESGDATDLAFKRAGQIETLDIRQVPLSNRGKGSPVLTIAKPGSV